MAHALFLFVLAILIGIACEIYEIRGKAFIYMPILVSFLYACTDEIHQNFVDGRNASIAE